MLTHEQLCALIPHDGAMCLLDRVVAWDDAGIHCCSDSHRLGDAHPLWRDNGIAAVHLIEYGAQAAAVHGGLLARNGGRQAPAAGYLAGVRDIVFVEQAIDTVTKPLDTRAYREISGPQGMVYHFEVNAADMTLCSGRLTVMRAI